MIFQMCLDRYIICEYGNVKPLVSCVQVGASLFLLIIVARVLQIVYELNVKYLYKRFIMPNFVGK